MADNDGSGSGLEGLSEKAYEIARRRQAAAQQIATMLEDQYDTWFASSAATLMHAAAWLAGTSLHRSFESGGDIQPGSAAFAQRSDEEGLKLLKVFMFLVDKDGIKLKPEDFALDIPEELKPHRSIREVQEHFQSRYNEVMRLNEFDYLEGAKTGAVACARLMKLHCLNRTDLQAPVGASIVSKGFVEGVKTIPAAEYGESGTQDTR